MSAFLSHEELRQLTGRAWRNLQIGWLTEHGWRYTINAAGEVIVARAEFEAKLVSGNAQAPESAIRWGEVKSGRKTA